MISPWRLDRALAATQKDEWHNADDLIPMAKRNTDNKSRSSLSLSLSPPSSFLFCVIDECNTRPWLVALLGCARRVVMCFVKRVSLSCHFDSFKGRKRWDFKVLTVPMTLILSRVWICTVIQTEFSLPLIKITIAKTQARLSQNALGWSTVLDKHYCVKTSSGDRVRIPTML